MLGSPAPAAARGPTVWLALPERGGIFEEAALALRAALAQLNPAPGVEVALWDEFRPERNGVPALIVAMGTPALRGLLALAVSEPARRAWPVVAALVPKSSFDASPPPSGMRVSAAFLDQPLARYAALIELALPDRPRVGVVLGPTSVGLREALASALAQRRLSLADSTLGPGAGPEALFPALSDVLERSDVLLALPDPLVVSAASLQNLLIAAYRQRKPVVSFAASHVRAGAGLALYTTPRQSAVQAAAMAATWLATGTLPAPQFATAFEVSTNERVLRSLGLPASDAETLTRSLRQREPER
ncbi:MAG: hypothetical protein MUE43_08760 [Serpentinimonas sp.]|jgi:ABC-type uncharacterized transport system substrate-binding protein|nr:hypothetical protein [Serpentinimonas sp.]